MKSIHSAFCVAACIVCCGFYLACGATETDPVRPDASQTRPLPNDAASMKNTIVTPVLDYPTTGAQNIIWCATAQMAWDELRKLAGESVQFEERSPVVEILNANKIASDQVDPEATVAMAGWVIDGIVDRIRKALNEKFEGEAHPKLFRQIESNPALDFIVYAYLSKTLPFKWEFERFRDYPFKFMWANVQSFGISQYLPDEQDEKNQASRVSIYDYRDRDDFIIELKTQSEEDRLILAEIPPESTLKKTVQEVIRRVDASQPEKMIELDELKIPVIDFSLVRDFDELMGKPLVCEDKKLNGRKLDVVRQAVDFRLDERGAILRSEAEWIAFGVGEDFNHYLIFDRPYLVMIRREGCAMPYFAMWVANAELMAKFDHAAAEAKHEAERHQRFSNLKENELSFHDEKKIMRVMIDSYQLSRMFLQQKPLDATEYLPPWSADHSENAFRGLVEAAPALKGLPTFKIGPKDQNMNEFFSREGGGSTPHKLNDPHGPHPDATFCYWTGGKDGGNWILWSAGPDGDYDLTMADVDRVFDPDDPAPREWMAEVSFQQEKFPDISRWVMEHSYDPTNGSESDGDIFLIDRTLVDDAMIKEFEAMKARN